MYKQATILTKAIVFVHNSISVVPMILFPIFKHYLLKVFLPPEA